MNGRIRWINIPNIIDLTDVVNGNPGRSAGVSCLRYSQSLLVENKKQRHGIQVVPHHLQLAIRVRNGVYLLT